MTNKPDVLDEEDLKAMGATRVKNEHPSMWNVVFCNDPYSPMDFVVFVLKSIFHKTQQDAEILTWLVHIEGKGIAGTYSHEVAETKQTLTMDMAKLEQHPLLVVLEKV